MLKKFFIFFVLIISFGFNNTFSYSQAEIIIIYDKFYNNLSKKVKSEDKKIQILTKLDNNINLLLDKTKSKKNIEFLTYLQKLNKQKINFIKNLKIQSTNIELASNNNLKQEEIKINNTVKNTDVIIEKNKKYSYEEISSIFSNYFDTENPYSIENGVYYSYKYNYYLYFDDNYGLYLDTLSYNNIDPKKTLIIKDKNRYYFSNDYQKVRLTTHDIIKDVTNKNEFLFNILDDNRFFVNNYDEILNEIKTITHQIIINKNTKEEKIKAIYDWIIENIQYYENYTDGNKQIFSGVLTFKNKTGVCDGYTKLFSYMLSFAGIDDVEIKRGFVIDNIDFPNFGHAWVRIGDKYYDPTFDDPILLSSNGLNKKREYMYYAIPKELMYVNRFDGINIPDNLKNLSLEARKNIVCRNMVSLFNDYKDYLLMNKVRNRILLGLRCDEVLTIEKLSKKIPYNEVINFGYTENNLTYRIKSLNYYLVNDYNIENIVFNQNIDLKNFRLFKWINQNGTFDYRLAYNLVYY